MTVPRSPHRAWIEIDHAAIRSNLAAIQALAPGAEVIGVVKANAYGHGDVAVAHTLLAAGVQHLAVATIDEGMRLRRAMIDAPILMLWGVGPAEAQVVADEHLEPVVYDERSVEVLEAARGTLPIRVHLKIDTGLGRQGIEPEAALALAARIERSPRLALAGTMSHLAVPGEDDAYTEVQLLRLARVVDAMRSAGIDPGLVHVSASGGILAGSIGIASAIRPGIALYGMLPAGRPGGTSGCGRHSRSRPCRCASTTCRRARRSATGCASGPAGRRGSRRSGSAMATAGRAPTPTTAGCSFAASVPRSSVR